MDNVYLNILLEKELNGDGYTSKDVIFGQRGYLTVYIPLLELQDYNKCWIQMYYILFSRFVKDQKTLDRFYPSIGVSYKEMQIKIDEGLIINGFKVEKQTVNQGKIVYGCRRQLKYGKLEEAVRGSSFMRQVSKFVNN